MKERESNCHSKKYKVCHLPQRGPDTKTNWQLELKLQFSAVFSDIEKAFDTTLFIIIMFFDS
jgi:hypothetical protein